MGCGQSGISEELVQSPHYLNNQQEKPANNFKRSLFEKSQAPTQIATPSSITKKRKGRLSQQQIIEAYDKTSGKIYNLFDELSQRISQYYMQLSIQGIQAMSVQKMTQLQTKIYLAQQFLLQSLSIMKVIGQKNKFQYQIEMFKIFNDSQSVLINYIKQKYPRAGAVFVPGDIMQEFQQFNMVQSPQNDILRNAGISFVDSSNQEIIKKLKKFFNILVQQTDSKFNTFQDLLIKNVFTYQIQGKKKLFNYKIGRKLPQNTGRYDSSQSEQLSIISPELFRMIIKWVTDMEEYLRSPQQEVDQKQFFKTCSFNKDETYFDQISPDQFPNLIQNLKNKLKQINQGYKKQINSLLQQMHMFNANLLRILYTTQRKQKYVPQQQAHVIKYAMFNTKLVSWLMSQKLITVLKNLINIGASFEQSQISRRIDLVKFNVKDLLRAMVVGNKKQIMTVYGNMKKLQFSGQLKIIQIKNRLGTALNDAMVIFKMKDSFLICQLQLVLSQGQGASQKVKSIQTLNHFLYQLVRSPYGVLSQVSVLLGYKDNKINYEDKIRFQNKYFSNFVQCEQKHITSIIVQKVQRKPFICSQCTEFYQPFQNIFGYKKCQKCQIYQCCKCMFKKNPDYQQVQVDQRFKQQLQCQILDDKSRKSNPLLKQINIDDIMDCLYKKKFFFKDIFSKKGFQKLKPKDIHTFLKEGQYRQQKQMQSSILKSQINFMIVQFKGENVYLKFLHWNQKLEEIQHSFEKGENFYDGKIGSSFYDFIIFFKGDLVNTLKLQDLEKLTKMFLKPQVSLLNAKKFTSITITKNKQPIHLIINIQVGQANKVQGLQNIDQNADKKQFKFASIAQARKSLPSISIVLENFQMKNQGLTTPLLVDYFTSYKDKDKIKTLNLSNNKIVDASIILKMCLKLQNLILAKNFIKVFKIQNSLDHLAKLILFQNKLVQISGFTNVKNLRKFNIQSNEIKKLQILKLDKLNQLILSYNKMQQLSWLQKSQLPNLQTLNVRLCGLENSEQNLKKYTFNFVKLKKIQYCQNPTHSLALNCPQLKYLDCMSNGLVHLQFSSQKIQQLFVNSNSLQNLSEILTQKVQNTKKIKADYAGVIKSLPKINADNLQLLSLTSCQIQDVSNLQNSKLPKLKQLNLGYNIFTSFSVLTLPSLITLDLQSIPFKILNQIEISDMPLLQQLFLCGDYEIYSRAGSEVVLPKFIFNSLKKIRLQRFCIKQMNDFSQSQLPNLTDIEIYTTAISKISKIQFPKLKNLNFYYVQILDCSGLNESNLQSLTQFTIQYFNKIDEQNKGIVPLNKLTSKNLSSLSIYNCANIDVQKLLACNLQSLKTVVVTYCNFGQLPKLNTPQLETMAINYCQVKSIQNLKQSNIQKIKQINFQNNKIETLPKLNISTLQKFLLSYNQLTQLTYLDCMKLNSSHLKQSIQIPKFSITSERLRTDISKLPALIQLNVSNNKLPNFPILNLQSLKNINISNNSMKSLKGLSKSKIFNVEQLQISQCLEMVDQILPEVQLNKALIISVSYCNIKNIDKFAKSNLASLQKLTLQSLQVETLPVFKLPKLQTFTFYGRSLYGDENQPQPKLISIDNISKWQCPQLNHICIKKTKITLIPSMSFPKLTKLELDNNKQLKSAINLKHSNLPQLQCLNMNENKNLTEIGLPNGCQMDQINLSNCALTDVKSALQGIKFTKLYAQGNQIINLGKIDTSFTQQLNLQNNKIQDITSFLRQAYKLKSIYISNNNIKQIPDIMFSQLQNIYADNNKITKISFSNRNFPNLSIASLQNNQIQQVHQVSCLNLSTLNLSTNLLKQILFFPNDVQMANVYELKFNDNQIKKISYLPDAMFIYLQRNKLQNLDWMPKCKTSKLYSIFMSQNQIKNINGLFHKDNVFETTYTIQLNDNKIEKIDLGKEPTCKFPSMSSFLLYNNQIQYVNNISSQTFPYLSILNFKNNKIKKFGPNVKVDFLTQLDLSQNTDIDILGLNCPNLSEISLLQCNIKQLNWFNKLQWPALKTLKVHKNQIKKLIKITSAPSLQYIYIEENPLEDVDELLNSIKQDQHFELKYDLIRVPIQRKEKLRQKIQQRLPQSFCLGQLPEISPQQNNQQIQEQEQPPPVQNQQIVNTQKNEKN